MPLSLPFTLPILFKPPENLKKMGASKVNAEIWYLLPRRTQTADASQHFVQQFISHRLVTQVKITGYLSVNATSLPSDVL